MTTREKFEARIAELREQLEAAQYYGNASLAIRIQSQLSEVENDLDILNEDHAEGATVAPVVKS